MQLRVSLIIPILVAYLNLDPGESCFANIDRTMVIRNVSPLPGCQCGIANYKEEPNVTNPKGRILDGIVTGKNEFPWQVGIVGKPGDHPGCGGSIVSSNTIITAAHCVQGTRNWGIIVGEHNYEIPDGERFMKVRDVIEHPNFKIVQNARYGYGVYYYDYAILKLYEHLTWKRDVMPICLPTVSGVGSNYEDKELIVSGWGMNHNNHSNGAFYDDYLNKVNVHSMTNDECRSSKYKYEPHEITQDMFCAINPLKGICYGDSGGPLMIQEGKRQQHFLVGIVSWGGMICGAEDSPGVYARVTYQLDWIKERIEGDECPINSAVSIFHELSNILMSLIFTFYVGHYNILS